jgi:tellurite resistance protein TehA-like permease
MVNKKISLSEAVIMFGILIFLVIFQHFYFRDNLIIKLALFILFSFLGRSFINKAKKENLDNFYSLAEKNNK